MALAAALMIALFAGCGSKTEVPAANAGPQQVIPAETPEQAPGAAAADSAGAEKAPVTLKVGLLGNSVKPVGVLVADALGYYAEEGVNVEFEKVSSMNDAYMAVST